MKRLVLAPLALLFVACGGSVAETATDGGTDGGIDSAITTIDTGTTPKDSAVVVDSPPSRDAVARCNDLVNTGRVIAETNNPGELPALLGAASIPSGTYVLVESTRFTGFGGTAGPTGKTMKETLVVTPTEVQSIISQDGGPDEATTTAYAIVGSRLRVTPTCGSSTAPTVDFMFDATASAFRIGFSAGGVSMMLTFLRV
jgi:hypothetical protein